MANFKEWEKEVDNMNNVQLGEIKKALETLKKWEMFDTEFQGVNIIRGIVQYEHLDRENK